MMAFLAVPDSTIRTENAEDPCARGVYLDKGMEVTAPCDGWFVPEARARELLAYEFQVKGGIGGDGQPWLGYENQLNNCNGDMVTMKIDRDRWKRKAEKRGNIWKPLAAFAGGAFAGSLSCQAIQ